MELDEVRDRAEIEAVLHDFAVGLDLIFGTFPIHLDPAAAAKVLELFAPDGILHTPVGRTEGREAIRAGWERVATFDAPPGGPKYCRHHLTSCEITLVDSSTAHTTVYVQAITDRGLDHWGWYEDRMVKLADGWKFAERLVTVHDWVDGGYYASLPTPQNPVRSW